ncbi:hypothetical protein, partial [Aliarcobacter butzleri]|uniref:hypothetical protein n=1 Tax=Aliarcobacter butzleri TaxID=28197 RepID=UPI00344CEBAD
MKRYLFLIVFCIECFSQTGNNLKLPNENVYDFTMQESKGIKKEEIVERILVEIGKENLLERRKSNLFNCNYDKYNNSYCPINLVKAESYWDYTSNYDYKL